MSDPIPGQRPGDTKLGVFSNANRFAVGGDMNFYITNVLPTTPGIGNGVPDSQQMPSSQHSDQSPWNLKLLGSQTIIFRLVQQIFAPQSDFSLVCTLCPFERRRFRL